jgi:cytochrome c peroxidase
MMNVGRTAACVLGLALVGGCNDAPLVVSRHEAPIELQVQSEPLLPLPAPPAQDPARVALGAKLFADARLSADGTVACASCHVLARGGADGRRVSLGIHGRTGSINAPSVLNSGLNFVQFWDGRAATLEEQVDGPLLNSLEMANDWPHLLSFLKGDSQYPALFRGTFSDGINEANTRTALATFERTLLTPDSKFDRWLRGDKGALSATEVAGYERFKNVGCIACHQGSNIGGNMFQRFGVMGEYFQDRGQIETADYGRFNVTHLEQDRFVFRVPSLRNVALTAPYFHDGSAATLEEAVATMAKYQLGQTLDAAATTQIVAFLQTLTGRIPDPLNEPALLANRVAP